MAKNNHKFDVGFSVNDTTGEILSVYLQVREGKAADVIEIEEGAVFANYNRNGRLLGVEMLAPCKVSVFDRITKDVPAKERRAVRRFLRGSTPMEMVAN